jgi:mRNA interferase MazF
MHDHLHTVIVAPMTTGARPAPYRLPVVFEKKRGLVLLDQIRALDKSRLLKRLGLVSDRVLLAALATLQNAFAA